MTRWILLISSLAVVSCRPQYNSQDSSSVESLEDTGPRVTLIPFYGGGKGQSLQIVQNEDGTFTMTIIKTPENKPSEEPVNAAELENPPLPSKHDLDFGPNIQNLNKAAFNIIKLQEIAKQNGKLNAEQEAVYQKNMDVLNTATKNLAELQEPAHENREGLTEWFDRKRLHQQEKKKTDESSGKEEGKKGEQKKEEQKKEEGKKEKPKEEEEETEENGDGIAIGLPAEDASVAEAKPVGLAVAGEGGVAASKPIATAVVGPGGLAIARPVGTAIAGVAPDQALVPIYAEGYIAGTKPKRYGTNSKPDAASELLNKIISKYHQV